MIWEIPVKSNVTTDPYILLLAVGLGFISLRHGISFYIAENHTDDDHVYKLFLKSNIL